MLAGDVTGSGRGVIRSEASGATYWGNARDGYSEFLGIPFAQPPVGDLRFRSPQPIEKGEKQINATSWKLPCPQSGNGAWSEDCLYLNIYSSSDHSNSHPTPVMVFLHGGCYVSGSPYSQTFNGSALVTAYAPLIVVTVAYRLNVFGFLAHDDLRSRSPSGSTGNYGIQDQRAALRWIRDNIAAFGGDPGNVFVWGQSAGAASVSCHLATKRSWGLFQRAGMESGSFGNWAAYSWQAAQDNFNRTLAAAACSDVDCLIALPASELVSAGAFGGALDAPCRDGCAWAPTIDGVELTTYPWDMELQVNVSILHGSNMEDGEPFVNDVVTLSQTANESNIENYTSIVYEGAVDASSIAQTYYSMSKARDNYSKWFVAGSSIETDFAYACPALRTSAKFNKAYQYEWAYRDPGATFVVHGSELPYVFMTTSGDSGSSVSQAAALMSSLFVNCAKQGTPSDAFKP